MITREQAEQAFSKYREDLTLTYEMRDPQFAVVDTNDIEYRNLEYEVSGELEEAGWRCTYERRYKDPAGGGTWPWHKAKCYIVEAKPGPYVIE